MPRIKFGLGMMFLLFSICACFVAIPANHARRQRAVFNLARELGGRVRYDHEPSKLGRISFWISFPLCYTQSNRPKPWGPRWAHAWLGEECFHEIVAVELASYPLKPQFEMASEMKILDPDDHLYVDPHAVWPLLRVLSPSEVQQLQELCSLGQLKHIKFEDVLVDAAILEILARCQSLESLWVRPAAFSDTELQRLANCVSLNQVDLVEARVDPVAAKYVAADSVSYKVTEDGVRQLLESLPKCTVCVSKNDSYGFPAIAPKTFRKRSNVL